MNKPELSYYALRLKGVLKTSFPNLLRNTEFIKERSNCATQAYQEAFESGLSLPQCNEIANQVLMKDLHFSPFAMVFEILCNEFRGELSNEELHPFALKMLEALAPFFEQYTLDEDFEKSVHYQELYTELTGAIQLWIEESGIS